LQYAGKGLREVCQAVGIPPVLHLGSCVDCSRILITLCNIQKEGGLGDDLSDLPAAGAAPEWMSEKAVAIGFYFVSSGVQTLISPSFPVDGAKGTLDLITRGLEKIVGAGFEFEDNPVKGAHIIIDHLNRKREALKLAPMMYELAPSALTLKNKDVEK